MHRAWLGLVLVGCGPTYNIHIEDETGTVQDMDYFGYTQRATPAAATYGVGGFYVRCDASGACVAKGHGESRSPEVEEMTFLVWKTSPDAEEPGPTWDDPRGLATVRWNRPGIRNVHIRLKPPEEGFDPEAWGPYIYDEAEVGP